MSDERVHLIGEYALDLARGRLLRGADPVHLRPQAYEVLRLLVERRGHLVSKDELIQGVWRGRAVGDDSLVQCLRDVRQALGGHGDECIRNVRGRGYIFDPVPDTPAVAEPAALEADRAANRRGSLPAGLALGGMLVLAVAAAGYWLAVVKRAPGPAGITSIAVLPFANDGAREDGEYLADGLTDSLINSLSGLPGLSVKSRGSVFRYKGTPVEPQRAAAELSVQAVLTGRAVQHEDELTLFLSLVDGRTGNQLWGEQYVRKLTDLAAAQQDITDDVAGKLQAHLSGSDRARARRDYTPVPDAYLDYLRGRYHALKTTAPDIRAGIAFYQRAVDADPAYALAYAGLADAYRALSIVGGVASNEAFPQARAAARRALAIDDSLADAHVALAWISFSYDWDWTLAERELRKAIELRPENPDALRAYAHLLSNLGRHAEALAAARTARELDPLVLLTNALEGQFLFYAGQLDEAESRLRKTLELGPDYWVADNALGRVHLLRRSYQPAIEAFTRARARAPDSTEPVTQLGYALARSGRPAEARAVLRELEDRSASQYVPAYSFALIHIGLGQRDHALEFLQRSFAAREVQLTFIGIDTRWDELRGDPRFLAIVRGMGLE